MPTSGMRRAGTVIELIRRYLPLAVEGPGAYRDWRFVGPGLLGLAASTLEAVYQLPPPRHLVQAEALTRSLLDYAITFAWLAAADGDELATRLGQFERTEWSERSKKDRRFREQLPQRSELYRDLIANGVLPDGLFSDEAQARHDEVMAEEGLTDMPNLIDRAFTADEHWLPKMSDDLRPGFAGIYAIAYTTYSSTAHASATAVSRMVSPHPTQGHSLVGYEAPFANRASTPYGVAISVVTIMLLVASQSIGWPSRDEVMAASATGLPNA